MAGTHPIHSFFIQVHPLFHQYFCFPYSIFIHCLSRPHHSVFYISFQISSHSFTVVPLSVVQILWSIDFMTLPILFVSFFDFFLHNFDVFLFSLLFYFTAHSIPFLFLMTAGKFLFYLPLDIYLYSPFNPIFPSRSIPLHFPFHIQFKAVFHAPSFRCPLQAVSIC